MHSREWKVEREGRTHEDLDEAGAGRADAKPVTSAQSLRQDLAEDDDGGTRDYDGEDAASAGERVEKDGCRGPSVSTEPGTPATRGGWREWKPRTQGLVDDNVAEEEADENKVSAVREQREDLLRVGAISRRTGYGEDCRIGSSVS